jgi:hypothetical protein
VALAVLDLGETLTSARCVTYVREFRHQLARFGDTPVVRDFTEQGGRAVLVGQGRLTVPTWLN